MQLIAFAQRQQIKGWRQQHSRGRGRGVLLKYEEKQEESCHLIIRNNIDFTNNLANYSFKKKVQIIFTCPYKKRFL